MIGKTISHYKILEKIGEGGMGVVYKTEDTKLKRTVALKFLPKELIRDLEAKERFIQEAQAAAALDHPNICTVHEINEVEGQTFISMAYIDGRSLKEKISSGPLEVGEALDIAVQVAEGLQEAHEKGIIHRDIKPGNIMLTEKGQSKIMDFGLAKLEWGVDLTKTATIMGTVAYMSPEQAKGDEVNHRTDIWSLGAVLYEMLAGKHPFKGTHDQALMYSVVNEEPEPLSNLRSGMPIDLEKILAKALKKNKEDRYQHVNEMLTDLRDVQRVLGKPEVERREKKVILKRRWITSPLVWSLLVILVVITCILIFSQKKGISFEERDWILIADFKNTTGNEVFSGALEESVEKELSQSKYVNVVPAERKYDTLRLMKKELTTSVDEDMAKEIALRDGEIRAILSGSIRQIGETFSITIKVINPQNGSSIATYIEIVKGMDDIFYAVRRLANNVRGKLGESLAEIETSESQIPKEWYEKVTTSYLKALKLYRKAYAYANQFNWEKCLLFSQQAIEQDPSFAMAYTLAAFMNFNMGHDSEAKDYVDRAFQFVENLTDRERYFIQGAHALINDNYNKAIGQYSILVDFYPDDFWGHINLFDSYAASGNYEKAHEHLKEANRVRPNDPGSLSMLLLYELSITGNIEIAKQYYNQIAQIAPNFDYPHYQFFRSLELWLKEDLEGARKELQDALNRTQDYSSWSHYGVRMTYVNFEIFTGEFQQAIEELEKTAFFYREKNVVNIAGDAFFQLSLIYRELGEEERFRNQMQILVEEFPDPVASAAAGWLAYHEAQSSRLKDMKAILERLEKSNFDEKEKKAFLLLIEGERARGGKKFEEAIEKFKAALVLVNHIIHPPPNFYHPLMPLLALAQAYEQNDQLDLAIEVLQRIVKDKVQSFLPGFTIGPFAWIKAHYHLGRLYQKKAEKELAIEYLKKFIGLWKEADRTIPEVSDSYERLKQLSKGD